MSSHNFHRMGRPTRVLLCTLLIVLALGGCGGGVDSGGTGAPRSASASGPITGFGSVIVNGVHFDYSSASITDAEGTVHSSGDLKLGMTTTINGSGFVMDANGARSTATNFVFGSAIFGPIDSLSTNSLVVLGQTVDVKPITVFEVGLSGGLAALSVNDFVEVYALFNASIGHYIAMRIERKSGVLAYRLRGMVSNLNTGDKSFNMGPDKISYAGVPAGDALTALANGRFAQVQLQTAPVGGVWIAIRLRDGVGPLENRDDARIEGLISDFTSGTQFSVDGVSVDASRANVAGSVALGLGIRVAVEGTASSGVLVASQVQSKTETDVENEGFELDGSISRIDTTNKNFVLNGVTVDYSGSVVFLNGTISDVAVGKRVEVKGIVSADGTGLQAFRIQFTL